MNNADKIKQFAIEIKEGNRMKNLDEVRTLKGLLLEMKLSSDNEMRILAEETLISMFDEAVKLKDEEWRKVVEPLVEVLKFIAYTSTETEDSAYVNIIKSREAIEDYEKKVGEK